MKLVFVDVRKLIDFADEVHFNSACFRIVGRAVSPLVEIEICTQFTVDAFHQIQIELRGHTCAIIIGGFEHPLLFLQVNTNEQPAVAAANIRNATQEINRFLRLKVANRRSWKINNLARRFVTGRRQCHSLQVIGTDRKNFEISKDFLEQDSRFTQLLFGDIYGNINGRTLERFDQNARLRTCASAESDELDVRTE